MNIGNRFLQRIADLTVPDRVLVYPKWIIALFIVALLISIFVFGQPPLDSRGTFIGNDFVAFYTGAKLWMDGKSPNIYDLNTQKDFQHSLVNHLSKAHLVQKQYNKISPFINPPISILLYLPFAQGGYMFGLVLWWLFGFFCLGVSIYLMQKHIPGLNRWSLSKLLGMTVMFFPTLLWISYGQATTVILCIWSICYALLRLRREFWAGFVLSFLVFKPQLALGFAFPLILKMRIRALAGGIVGLGGWIALTYFVFPTESLTYLQQIGSILEILRNSGYPSWGIHSFYGFSNLAVYPIAPVFSKIVMIGLSLLGILFCITIWWKKDWDPKSDEWNTSLAISIPVCLLLAIQLYSYDLMLLLFPYFLIISQKRYHYNPDKYLDGGVVLAWTTLVYCSCFLSGYLVLVQQAFFRAIHQPQFGIQLSVIFMIGWCLALWRNQWLENKLETKQST